MAWYDIGSNSGETTVESSFCEYHMDHWSFCTCQGPAPSSSPPSYHLSRPPSHYSHPSPDLEADDSNIDPNLQNDMLPASLIPSSRPVFQPNPPPLAAGHNYHPEARAEEHAQVFSELPPELNSPGTSCPQNDDVLEDIQGEIDRLAAAQSSATLVPMSAESTGDANRTRNGVNGHPIGANGRPCHGECGPHSCSRCRKSFCQESRLTRHERSHKRPYICHVCGAARTWAHHLARHIATHGIETFSCPINGCSKTFTTTANIPRHLQNLVCHGLTKERSKQVMQEYKRMLHRPT